MSWLLSPRFYVLARLTTEAKALDQRLVTVHVLALEVGQQAATLVDQHQESAAAVMILLVGLEVLGELFDASREQGDLDFGGAGVVRAYA